MFINNAKQNSILPEICDNLCVEVASYKATLRWCREVSDQILTSQVNWSTTNIILWISLTPLTDPPCMKWPSKLKSI